MNYWKDRQAATQAALTKKNIKQTEKQLLKYYDTALHNTIGRFHITYNHILLSIQKGNTPTPADLYKLDKYWMLQNELQQEMKKLGDKQLHLFSTQFMKQWEDVYNAFAVKDDTNFNRYDDKLAQQLINEIWCADGKNWSTRVWNNTQLLQEALNEELVNCVINGNTAAQLRERLQSQFDVSWSRADALVRTELAHIQTKAAEQRYKDMGVKKVQVWADEDERRCDVCGELHEKIYMLGESIPIPAHPRCRCCIIPVIED